MSGAEQPPAGPRAGESAASKRERLARLLEKRAASPRSFPLSFAQQRLWFLDRLSPGNPAYNVSTVTPFPFSVHLRLLPAALLEVVRRHGTLRTTFEEAEGQPVQVVAPPEAARAPLVTVELDGLPPEAREAELARLVDREIHTPFDLARGPLLRLTYVRLGTGRSVLVLVMHHIVSDGWSLGVLEREVLAVLEALARGRKPELPELPVQYVDYAHTQRLWLQGEALAEQAAFWRERLADVPPLDLPADRPRPAAQSFRGGGVPFRLPLALIREARGLGQGAGATLFMVLLAGYQAFLHRYSGQALLAVGSPVAGRSRPELEGLIGLFVNMVVLRSEAAGDPSFLDFLDRARRSTLDALSHQEMPFEKLVELLQPERDPSRTPLFQAAFVLQNTQAPVLGEGDPEAEPLGERATAKFDLTLEVTETAQGLRGVLEFNRDLFDRATAERMARHLERLLADAVEAPEARISELALLDGEERAQLLAEGAAREAVTASLCLHELFEERAAAAPHAPAVTLGDETLSYGELDEQAGRLATRLRAEGVGTDTVVALLAERSFGMIVGILGILKAGGAYLPLDPAYPAERLAYLLEDSGTKLVVSGAGLEEALSSAALGSRVVVPLGTSSAAHRQSTEPLRHLPEAHGQSEESLRQGTEGHPQSAESLRQSTERLRQSAESLPQRPEGLLQSAESLPQSAESLPQSAESLPQRPEGLLQSTESLPQSAESLPQSNERLRQGTEDHPQSAESLRQSTGRLLQSTEGLRQSTESRPKSTESLAYVIYTSGSTGQPKGSLISHANAVRLLAATQGWFGFGPDDVWTLFHSFAFDFSVWEIWGALAFGGRLVIVPRDTARSPEAFLDLLARERVTVLNQTPSAFRQLAAASEGWDGELALRHVIFGGEALEPASLVPWFRRFGDERPRLVNMYGITETTVHVTLRPLTVDDAARPDRSPIGVPIPDLAAHAVDRWLEPVPYGVAGELAVGGAGLARGYLGRPDLTAERFVPDPHADVPGSRLYRSGDLARRLPDGAGLVYGGRIDQQVKIRGYRVEPGEIEAALAAHPGIREAVVVVREDTPGDRRLVAYVVGGGSPRELREHLLGRLPEHMVPAAFVALDALPLTVNGKLDRKALPPPDFTGEAADTYIAPRGPVEEVIAGIWSEVLKAPRVGVDDDFFALGGHSLLATQVVSRVRAALGISLPLHELFDKPTVRGLAGLVARGLASGGAPEPPPLVPARRDAQAGLPLSYAQERLWFLHRLEPHSPAYNIATAVRLAGPLDVAALAAALSGVAARHEALRTTFPAEGLGEPVQRVAPPAPVPLPVVDLAVLPPEERERAALGLAAAEAAGPFDLEAEPPLRARLVRLGEADHALLLTLHHIAADGWSLQILVRELTALYRGEALPPLAIQYADFAAWQRRWLQGEALAFQLGYWRERLVGAPAELDLPGDRPRPPVPSGRGGVRVLPLPADLAAAVAALGRQEGATVYMVLLAAFGALLHRYTGRDDLVLGSDVAQRNRAETEPLIGFFVNQLLLRLDLAGDPAFRALLGRARQAALGAYAHQDLPFGKLVEELRPERDLSRTPLFQILFSLHNLPPQTAAPARATGASGGTGGLDVRELPGAQGTAKFDLSVEIAATPAGLRVNAEYSSDLFDPTTIDRLLGHYETLLAAAVQQPAAALSRLPLLREAERHQLLAEWNDSGAHFPGGTQEVFHRLFDRQAEARPDAVAAVCEGERLTYGELREASGRLARALAAEGLEPDGVAALLGERGLPFLTAMIGVFKAGGAYLPLDPRHPAPRLSRVLAGGRARLLVAERRFAPVLAEALAALPTENRPPVLELEELLARPDQPQSLPQADPSSLAYAIFTSGSTGTPKGAMVEHRGLLNHLWAKISDLGMTAADTVAQTASQAFDISVWQFLAPLLLGGKVEIVPDDTAHDPARLTEATDRAGVTILETVPSLLRFLVEEIARRDTRPALAALRWMIPTGEALPPELARQWLRLYPWIPLLNAYGPTECSDDVTHHRLAAAPGPGEAQVPIGRPVANLRLYVVDRGGEPLPAGVPGELRVGGAGVGRGYRGDGARTADVFVPDPFASEPGARLYRTGDLGRRRADGTIDFLGRLDHQVKIRGHRIELGEVEAALAGHPAVRQAVVIAPAEAGGGRRLVAFLVAGGAGPVHAELRAYLEERLPEAMIPAAFVTLDTLPLTANGKVDRRALEGLAPASEVTAAGATPGTPLEEALAAVWAEVLRLPRVGLDDDFFLLGGHSLLATQVVSRIQRAFGVAVPLREVFDRPTVRKMAGLLAAQLLGEDAARPAAPIPRVDRGEHGGDLPLSFSQQRLWFLDRLQPGSATYNVPAAVRLLGRLDEPALRAAFAEIARRHEALRTTFPAGGDRPRQLVHPPGPVAVPRVDLDALPEDRARAEARRLSDAEAARPFDLAAGPLLRVTLVRMADGEHTLLVTLHHIISDGWSAGVLTRELAALYRGFVSGEPAALPELPIQYTDFAAWQRAFLSGETLEEQVGYWRRRLAGASESLELPADRPRRPVQRLRGGGRARLLSAGLTAGLRDLAREQGATLFLALLAAFGAVLQRYTGQDDLVIGTPVAGRNRVETEGLIGFFVNTLALRCDLSGVPPLRELLARTRDAVLGDFAHQDLPFEKLVEELAPQRDLSRSPLFQVMLVLQNAAAGGGGRVAEPLELPGLTLAPAEFDDATTKFDLSLLATEAGDRLRLVLGFDRDLFDGTTAARMLGHFETLLAAAVADPGRPIAELPLLTEAEAHQALREWIDTREVTAGTASLHELFARQAARDPDAVAVEAGDLRWTYRELAKRAGSLAERLRALGVGPDRVVGLLAERSPELVLGVLGILEAGGAFLPLDPSYPRERLAFMLEDSGADVLLAAAGFAAALPSESRTVVLDAWEEPADDGPALRSAPVDPDSLAYVIYTSGSTGRPKGVMVRHRSLASFIAGQSRVLGHPPGRRCLLFVSPSFDASLYELCQALASGATVCVLPRESLIPGPDLARRLREERVDTLVLPTAVLAAMPEAGLEGITCVTTGGEACPPSLAARWGAGRRLLNAYGPTETTVCCTLSPIGPTDEGLQIEIGRPMLNVEAFLADRRLRPVPAGVPGELYLGGECLARGYLGRPDLTAERFVPHAFNSDTPGTRLYRTGDLARWLADGRLDFLGRADHQVKVRGFRVELGEIEEVLARHPGVTQAVVVARLDRAGRKELAACVAPAAPDLRSEDLRQYLAERLPGHMVPTAFVLLPALPLTANGKVDRKALAAPEALAPATPLTPPGSDLEKAIAAVWREVLETEAFGVDDNFFDVGGHSLRLVEVQSRLERLLGRDVPVVDLFQHPTVRSLAAHLEQISEGAPTTQDFAPYLTTPSPSHFPGETGIALIGMSGRFPGAADVETFWKNLRGGVESIARFTDEELLAAGVAPAVLASPGYVRAGGVLEGVELFDADFFGYSPREAEIMDPQQRLFLEQAWHAVEDAGYDPRRLRRPVGVYAGAQMSSYAFQVFSRPEVVEAMGPAGVQTGIDKDYVATRVSYELGLKGPSLTVQTACSTSLVAIHLACQALRLGECDMALAGGVTVRVPQGVGYVYQEGGVNSPDGHCRAFDAAARGMVSGNGVGVVVLKRLEDALRDGDTIHAVVKGSAINNDGSLKVGFTAPSVEGQAEVIAAAHAAAGVSPDSIGYVEAHGTGTTLGDPIEVAALTRAFRAGAGDSGRSGYCLLGSLKTNVGHLDAAAGVAGFLKAALAVERGEIPPSLHFESPNPKIDFAASPFRVVTELRKWEPEEGPRRAGVSSFGIGGTNAHAVLEQPPAAPSAPAVPSATSGPSRPFQLLLLSARTPAALEEATGRLAAHLAAHPEQDLADVAFTLQVGRTAFEHRRAVVTAQAGAVSALGECAPTVRRDPGRPAGVAFLFPGQGAQYAGMGRGLYEAEPLFRRLIDEYAEKLRPRLGRDLREVLFSSDPGAGELRDTRLAQPALFAVEHALARLWMSWGIVPRAMIGHSLGEYVAACLAGVLSVDDALDLVALRGELMQSLPGGAMLSVDLPEAELAPRLAGTGLSLAAVNGPSLTVASGPEEAVTALAARLEAEGVPGRRLHTSHAFHSESMDPVLEAFRERVARISLRPPSLPYVSNLTGDWITAAEATDPAYWAAHLRQTVRFGDGLARLLASAPESGLVLLEVGPGRSLGQLARAAAKGSNGIETGIEIAVSMRHPKDAGSDPAVLLGALGRLWAAGVEVDWTGFYGEERRRRVSLPGYPFQRRRFWIEPGRTAAPRAGGVLYAPAWKSTPAPALAPSEARWLFAVADPALAGLAGAVAAVLAGSGCTVGGLEEGTETAGARVASFGAAGLERIAGLEVVVTTGAQAVTAAESERLDPETAAVTGLCRALRCRHVDVDLPPAGSWQHTRLARALAAELSVRTPGMAVAYRSGERWAETYEPLPASPAAAPSPWLAPGAVCALTGAADPLADRLAAALGAQVERDDPAAVRARHGRLDLVLHWVGGSSPLTQPPPPRGEELQPAASPVERTVTDLTALEDALRAEPPAACLILSATADTLGDAGDLSAATAARAAAVADAFVRAHNQREPAPWMRVSLEAWGDGSPLALPDEAATAALARLLAPDPSAHVIVSSVPPRSRRAALEKQAQQEAETRGYERPDLETPYAALQGETEHRLAGLWRDLLGVGQVGRDDDFFELGGHSLLATRLISRIREAFGRELRLESVFEAPTLARLARKIEEDPAAAAAAIVRAPRPPEVPELPLSYAQQRLLFLDVLSPGDVSYNLGLGLRLQGDLRPAALRWALDRLVERHEVLRTTFVLAQGRPSQVIAPAAPLETPILDLAALPAETAEAEVRRLSVAEAHRPIDLFRGPVLRARLLRRAADEHALLLTLHHIAADGWSFGILYRELAELYEAAAAGRPPRLPELPVQYADFAWWQRSAAQREELERQLDYWRERLAGFTPAELPGDRPRPPVRSGRGAAHPVTFPPALAEGLRRLSREHEATMFMTLVSAFLAVLHYYLRGHDLTIGTDVANRTRGETEGLIGLFVNQLVLRNDLAGDPTFVEILDRVRRGTLEAYAHQDAPFDRLVEILNPVRDMSRTPLFQIKLVLQNTPMESRALPGLTISPLGFEQRTAKFDLLLNLSEGPAGITGVVEYSTDLYDAATVARLTDRFARALARVAERSDVRLGEVAAELAERDREEEQQRREEHRQARTRAVERVRRKAIPVTG